MKNILTACLPLVLLACSIQTLAQEEVVEPAAFSDAELDQMLAPVALYPDTVLAHVLIASTYPLEVVQAARWAKENPNLNGDAAVKAVEDKDWDPSVKALAAFPEILQRMTDELDWTERLGNAFLDDEARVTDRIQFLRQRARQEGSLDNLENLKVVEEEDETIVIEPAVREVVYVPYYDTRYVYGNWWWRNYPPRYWSYPYSYRYRPSGFYTSFYWGPRINISTGFFFSGFHWRNHQLFVLDSYYNYYSPYYFTNRQVIRHRDARRWRHNPRHRRGVDYRGRRTRDYYRGSRTRSIVDTSASQTMRTTRDTNPSRTGRTTRDGNRSTLRNDRTRRNADYVEQRLNGNRINNNSRTNSTNNNSPRSSATRSERTSQAIRERLSRRNNSDTAARQTRTDRRNDTSVQRAKRDSRQGDIKLRPQRNESSSRDNRASGQVSQNRDTVNRSNVRNQPPASNSTTRARTQRAENRQGTSSNRGSNVRQRSSSNQSRSRSNVRQR